MSSQRIHEEPQKWYVAYTSPKCERTAQNKLDILGVQSYLPIHEVVRDWSDRKKKLSVPLFPSYLFVHISDRKRRETFAIREIIRYVSFDGKPATVNDSTINSLRNILKERVEVNVETHIKGTPVKITRGPFLGIEGTVVNKNGKTRLFVAIEALQRSIVINIAASDVASLNI